MVKTQVYLRDEELARLHEEARRSGRSVAGLVREAIQVRWLERPPSGPIALWRGPLRVSSVEHDRIYDEP